jgi:hypothetical protein
MGEIFVAGHQKFCVRNSRNVAKNRENWRAILRMSRPTQACHAMIDTERMNNMNSVTPTIEDAMKYVTQENAVVFPNIDFYVRYTK